MKYPFMPLFNGDILADTLHLSAQMYGAYVLLIQHAWKHDAKVIVKDAQRISRVGNRHWKQVCRVLAPFFDPSDGLLGGALEVVHRRVATELAKAGEISNKRKDAAVQMHINKRANAELLHGHLHPQPQPQKKKRLSRQGMSPDRGDDYRSPPRMKSDNVLMPIPDKSPAKKNQEVMP